MTDNMPKGMRTTLGWVLGVAIIAFMLLILVVIFGNLLGNTGITQDTQGFSNETITLTDAGATPSTADNRPTGATLSGITVTNATGTNELPASNYTVSGVLISNTSSEWGDLTVNVTATVTYDSQAKLDSDSIILNYTKSASNVTGQFPTVGTIIGIAILLLILIALLVFAITKMMSVAGSTGISTGGKSSKFSGSDRDFS